MSPGAWQALGLLVGVIIAAITAAGGVMAHRAPRKQSPYDAIANRLVVLEEQRESDVAKIEALHQEVNQLKRERVTDQTEIASLQRRMVGVIDDRDDLVRYIGVLRAWIASGARPPAPAVPVHLADVLPAWIPGDGAEPPMRPRNDDPTGP